MKFKNNQGNNQLRLKLSQICQNQGYTLIEMMVAVAVISTITVGGVAAYTRYTQRQDVVNVGNGLVNTIREVQKRAQSGEKPEACGDGKLLGWRISYSTTGYNFGAVCGDQNTYVRMLDTDQGLANGVSFATTNEPTDFEALTGAVSGTSTLNLTSGNATYLISLSPAGGITNAGIQ